MNEKLRTFEDWWESTGFTSLGIGIGAVAESAWNAALESQKREEVRIELPLPHPHCSPNCQKHWRIKHKAKAHDRLQAFALAKNQGIQEGQRFSGYRLEFIFKDRRRRDEDNCVAWIKSYNDGISDACGQDDSQWKFRGIDILEPDKDNPRLYIIFDI